MCSVSMSKPMKYRVEGPKFHGWIDPRLPDEEYNRLILEKIRQRVNVTETGCWEWQGTRGTWPRNYGQISYRNRQWRLHRLMYVLTKGPVADDIEICHSCDNKPCCNPEHLWAGTKFDNMKDCGEKKRWPRQYRDTCAQGHPRIPENMVWHGKEQKLRCRLCLRERGKRRWRKNPEEMRARVRLRRALAKQRQAAASQFPRRGN